MSSISAVLKWLDNEKRAKSTVIIKHFTSPKVKLGFKLVWVKDWDYLPEWQTNDQTATPLELNFLRLRP